MKHLIISRFSILSLAAFASPAFAVSFDDCMSSTITRGSEDSNRQELNKRCDNTSTNYNDCKKAANLVRKAVEEHQLTVAETCRKQAKSTTDLSGQNTFTKGAGEVTDDANAFTTGAQAKYTKTNQTATEGKTQSEKAIKLVLDNPEKVKPERKPIITRILGDFKNTTYSDVKTVADYAEALKKIDAAWKSLQANPDMAKDSYADAYDATATYLNAEEVRLGTSYQRNQMSTASTAMAAKSALNSKSTSAFGEVGKNLGSLTSLATAAMGAAGPLAALAGAGTAAGTAASPAAVASLDNGTSTVSTTPTPVDTLEPGANLGGNSTGLISAGTNTTMDGSTSERSIVKSPLGSIAPKVADSGLDLGNSSSASRYDAAGNPKLDTSMRDSLKRGLTNGSSSGGEDAPLAANGKSGEPAKEAKPGTTVLDDKGVPMVVASPTDATDFSMRPGETDEAVNDLLAGFQDADKNEFAAGSPTAAEVTTGRRLASANEATAGIEGRNSTNLFSRVRSTMSRCVKKGCVTNGINNGKI